MPIYITYSTFLCEFIVVILINTFYYVILFRNPCNNFQG